MYRKRWAALVAATLCLSLVSGCGGQSGGSSIGSTSIQDLENKLSSQEYTVQDALDLARLYQESGRDWDACLLVWDEWSRDQSNEDLLQGLEDFPMPAPELTTTQQEDGSVIFTISDSDLSYLQTFNKDWDRGLALHYYISSDEVSAEDIILQGNYLDMNFSIESHVTTLSEPGEYTLNCCYAGYTPDRPFTNQPQYLTVFPYMSPVSTYDCTIDSISLDSIAFGELSGNGYLYLENTHDAQIYYTLDGTDPLVNGTLEGMMGEGTYIHLPAGVYTVSARCQSPSGEISDMIQDTFTARYYFDSNSNKVVEDSRYEYYITGSSPLYRRDKIGGPAEVLDESIPSALAAVAYDKKPSAQMHPQYILENERHVEDIYYLTGDVLHTISSQYYYYDGREETEQTQTAADRLETIRSVGNGYLTKAYADGSVGTTKLDSSSYMDSETAENMSLILGGIGYQVKMQDGNSLIMNHTDELLFEIQDHTVVLDAVFSTDEYYGHFLFFHYQDSPTEHYVVRANDTRGYIEENKQMTGRILLGYTENGVYFLDDAGQPVREAFDYSIFR